MSLQQVLARGWTWLTRSWFLGGVGGALAFFMLLSLILPQAPVSPQATAEFSRWLAEIRPSLGGATDILAALGLLTVRFSWWQRTLLAVLAISLAARAADLYRTWENLQRSARLTQLLLCLGCALLLVGWGLNVRSGWVETDVVAWPETEVSFPTHPHAFEAPVGLPRLARRGYGLYLIRQGKALGLNVRAEENGTAVALLTSTRGDPQAALRLIIDEQAPDAFFALKEPGFIFRVTLLDLPPTPQVQIQVYKSGGQALLTETTLAGSGTIFTEDLQIHLAFTSLPRLRVVYNPGAPLTALGWVGLLGAGIMRAYHSPSRTTTDEDMEERDEESEAENDA
jgi:hypothetical protein